MIGQPNKLNLTINILIGLGIITLLVALNFIIDLITEERTGWTAYLEQGLLIVNTLVIAWIIIRFLQLTLWLPYEQRYGKPPLHKLTSFINFLILASAGLYIITQIFNLPIWSITVLSGTIGAGLALGLKGVVLDFFSGLLLDIEKPFTIGDWIQIPEEVIGKEKSVGKVVIKNCRTTIVLTHDEQYVVIPNEFLTKKGIININRPEKSYNDALMVSLDYSLPIERAERLLLSALSAVQSITDHSGDRAWAINSNSGGIDYCLRYIVDDYDIWRKVRHDVLISITKLFNNYNLQISESIGSIAISRVKPLIQEPPLFFTQLASKIDLFKHLTKTEIDELAKEVQKIPFKTGDLIVKQQEKGDSMFVIGEGIVEVYRERKEDDKILKDYLATLGPGDYFGDMALLLGKKRTAFVKAITGLEVFEIPKKALEPILKKRPEIANKLSEIVTQRKISMQQIVMEDKEAEIEDKEKLYQKILEGIVEYFELDKVGLD